MDNNYICKIANREEVLARWDFLVKTHPDDPEWDTFRENTIKHFDDGSMVVYYGILDSQIICEATAYVDSKAFIGDIEDPSGLQNTTMAYLAAFRTNKEYEGQGYFRKLYNFMENDLKLKGYSSLSLGVSPKDVRDIEIYFHLGFQEYIKTEIEKDLDGNIIDFINYYKKNL